MPGRVVACVVAAVAVAGCGAPGTSPSAVDRLLDQIAAGGKARESAAKKLETILNRGRPAASSANGEKASRAIGVVLGELRPRERPERPTCGSYVDEEAYAGRRDVAELVIDVAGRSRAKDAVRRAVKVGDPYLAAWAIRAADRAGVDVSAQVVARVARDDYARSVLYGGPRAIAQRLPSSFQKIGARARADMAQWLAYPTELGCEPSELRLLRSFRRPGGRYFLFRFRPGGGSVDHANVFLAGVSGPWRADGTLASESRTFSDFKRTDSAAPQAHLRRILGLAIGERE